MFQLSGPDRPGVLGDITQLLMQNGCEVRSAAVWSHQGYAACVLGVTERGRPVLDDIKVKRLRQILHDLVGGKEGARAGVTVEHVTGDIHHERRLHQLLLVEDRRQWHEQRAAGNQLSGRAPAGGLGYRGGEPSASGPLVPVHDKEGAPRPIGGSPGADLVQDTGGQDQVKKRVHWEETQHWGTSDGPGPPIPGTSTSSADSSASADASCRFAEEPYRSPRYCTPEIHMQHTALLNYWLLTIRCRDRTKLFFDTVCTLADMDYDIFHGTIDSDNNIASQLYYIRPCSGNSQWDPERAAELHFMLTCSVQRRFPVGLKVHVETNDNMCLAELAKAFQAARLWITRARVRSYSACSHVFYLTDDQGKWPDRQIVQQVCESVQGRLIQEEGHGSRRARHRPLPPSRGVPAGAQQPGPGNFRFTFSLSSLERRWQQGWSGGKHEGGR